MRRPLPEKPPERTPIISVPALGPAFRVRGARRPVPVMDVFQAPKSICVAAFVRQSWPAEAIFSAGSDWGMPYAPLSGLVASHRQPDSSVKIVSRHSNWEPSSQPMSFILRFAILFASSTLAFSPSWSPAEHVAADEEPPPAPAGSGPWAG